VSHAAFSFARWPLNYLTTSGPRADPATALTWGLGALSILVVLIITLAVGGAVIVRRDRSPPADLAGAAVARSGGGLVWIYVGLPLTVLALLAALVWTMLVLQRIDAPPRPPRIVLEVTGRQWWWQVRYVGSGPSRSFVSANEIHIPVGEPVLVRLFGGDVIHSFWVPALTGKTDTIPGRTNLTWLQADKPGVYLGQCTEYCGLQHAHMAFSVVAQSPAEFEAWRNAQAVPAKPPLTADLTAGQATFAAHCGKCHTVSGTSARGQIGPDLTHLMSRAKLAAGVLDNNVDNLSGWISDPQSLKPGARMPPTFLSGPQLHGVVAYLETLK
jgi:cytochrome c oxidase subunit 2